MKVPHGALPNAALGEITGEKGEIVDMIRPGLLEAARAIACTAIRRLDSRLSPD
ncbi:hypothetical protein [Burkholderia ubonensis]|uniref:hypothetical protein n=1 Tax=Burkholderia ubonensis TaxID=101571 RepID=UPI000AA5E24D|nr:hypothetical protein [Burkholderia ubonensis]